MDGIQFTELEQKYYEYLFLGCDIGNVGKIPLTKVSELFRSANLSLETVQQIIEQCCGGRTTHLGRRQFYLALKLVAAAQAGLPLQLDLLQLVLDIPLPRFVSRTSEIDRGNDTRVGSPDLIQLSDSDSVPLGKGGCEEHEVESHVEVALRPNGGLCPSPPVVGKMAGGSPEASSTASDSPTPTNSVQERNWAAGTHWHGLVCEEQRQLLGTEEESSDRHSSDEDPGDVWTITDEQREYYSTQFRSLQPDPRGLVAGSVARTFFEKSRLPVQQLRKIWQLADVTKDGALSLEEFNTAMHLVVLRRNNIELPDALPPCLVPPRPAKAVSREESPPSLSPPSASPPRSKEWTKFVDSPTSSVSSPGPKPVNFDFHKSAVEQDPKILHPVPLRVTPESQPLPGTEEEPCRSPRKLTDPQPIPYEQLSIGDRTGSPKRETNNNSTTGVAAADIRPIQRPQPKKPAAPGPGAIPPPPQPTSLPPTDDLGATNQGPGAQVGPTSLPVAPKKEPPPPPPPRPYRTHTRSSSLDLNRMSKTSSLLLGAPPTVPPRVSPSTTSPKKLIGQRSEGDVLALVGDQAGFADFAQFVQDDEEASGESAQPRRHGAFEVYRKPVSRGSVEPGAMCNPDSPSQECQATLELVGAKSTVDQSSLHRLQEQNSLLIRVCQELNQELADVQEERAALDLRLEQLQAQQVGNDTCTCKQYNG
uniref:RALBP1 associated Eps domain containing 2 n=1 Tax=Timema monikensis TaxID=170555 RepID=A0A7R9E952_9NEOP|nr:unnamed protein product [Timema monikensis]